MMIVQQSCVSDISENTYKMLGRKTGREGTIWKIRAAACYNIKMCLK